MEPFVFFGGKGGVGKTTVSCAYGGVDGLDAMEIDPDTEVQRHLDGIRNSLSDQVSAAMVNEINQQLEMAHQTPGAYESALFDRFVDVMREADPYDRVVFDTSPTGSTLRLLGLPEFLQGWIDRLMHKREKSIDLFEKAAIGNNEPRRVMDGDPVLNRLRERKEFFEFASGALRSDAAFFFVLNPDQLSVNETRRAIGQMADNDLAVRGLVANKLTPEPDDDEDGRGARYLRDRVATEAERLREVRESLDPPLVAEIESRTAEVKGSLLDDVAAELDVETAAEPPTFVG